MPWDSFLMQVLIKKEVCGSREQCTGPTDKHILVKNLLVKKVVGPVDSAQDPLTEKIPREMCFSIKKEKKKENANAAPETQSKCICRLWVCLDTAYFTEKWKLKIENTVAK